MHIWKISMKGNRKNHAFSAYNLKHLSPVATGIYMLEKPSNSKEIESWLLRILLVVDIFTLVKTGEWPLGIQILVNGHWLS